MKKLNDDLIFYRLCHIFIFIHIGLLTYCIVDILEHFNNTNVLSGIKYTLLFCIFILPVIIVNVKNSYKIIDNFNEKRIDNE